MFFTETKIINGASVYAAVNSAYLRFSHSMLHHRVVRAGVALSRFLGSLKSYSSIGQPSKEICGFLGLNPNSALVLRS
jgi:hypothetical protein